MKIFQDIASLPAFKHPVVTVGTFDGVHLGHQQIFRRMKDAADMLEGETVVVTFHPHPRLVIHPDSKDLKFINSQDKKLEIMERTGIDNLVIIPFTREFSHLSSLEFVRRYLVEGIRVERLVVGYDHHFGKDRLGSFIELKGLGKMMGFEVEEVKAQLIDGIAVSSTKIRQALQEGNVRLANRLLGYDYSISGKVVYGNRLGRTIGFPTANIEVDDSLKLISAVGVYACKVEWRGRMFKGMGNIGYRPTIQPGSLTIEVHIFDFDEELYGERITIFFLDRIRDEQRFENIAALRDQLMIDKSRVLEILR